MGVNSLGTFIICSVMFGVDPKVPSIEDLQKGLIDKEAALESLSLTSRCDIKRRNVLTPDIKGNMGELLPLKSSAKYTIDRRGRIRYEDEADNFSYGTTKIYKVKNKAVFDGKQMRSMKGESQSYLWGRISANANSIPWEMDPREFTTRYFGKPLSQHINVKTDKVVGLVPWDGRKVTVVESAMNIVSERDRRKSRYLIDCDRNFTVVRKSILSDFGPGTKWEEYTLIEGHDFKEITPGIWVPMRVIRESYDTFPDREPLLSWRYEITIENWDVNQDWPDSTFKLDFPPGLSVNDEITGRHYQVAKISDQMLADQVAYANGLPVKGEPRRSPFLRGVLWLNGLLLAISVAGLLLRWWWKTRRAN